MDLRDQVRLNALASKQATSMPSGCKACQRQGIPIFPLRVAAVPRGLVNSNWRPVVPKQDVELTGGEFKYALRTLRAGYVYVLLDNEIWQSYQVTAEGYMRQFNPFAMPEGERIEPITQACRQQGHCISASFINIDASYSCAELAFSSDPWSLDVLKGYKDGTRPRSRFTQIYLSALKENPTSIPEALTLDPSLSSLKTHVAEFATSYLNTEKIAGESLGGAHGFYPRLDSEMAFGIRVAQLSVQYKCPITALVLNDSVGVIQELNIARLQIVEARQTYNETPKIRHQHMISQAINQYIGNLKKIIDETSQPRYEPPKNTNTVWGGKMIPKEQVAQQTYAEHLARLQQCYKEPERADFAQQYQQAMERYEQRIIAIGKDLAACYRSRLWLAVIEHDYAPQTSVLGWAAQYSTLTACIQGGSTDPATETMWNEWFQDKHSPAYSGLLGNQKSEFAAIYDGTGGYTNLKAVMGADEIGNVLGSRMLRRAMIQRMLAISGAFSRLASQLEQSALDGFTRVIQGFIYMTSKQEVTLFTLNITVAEFQQLYQDIARTQLSALGKPVMFEGLLNNGQQTTRTVATGSLLQVTDPEILKKRINVTLVSDMEPVKFNAALRASGTSNNAIKRQPLTDIRAANNFSELRISSLTLSEVSSAPHIIDAAQVREILREQSRIFKRTVSGNTLGLGLSAGMMYLQISALEANRKALDEAIGNDTKARLALFSNIAMVVSTMVESAGFIRTLAMEKPWALAKVHWLVRAGGVIAGVASIIDGIGMLIKWWDAGQASDREAARWYFVAGAATIAGGLLGVSAAWAGSFALWGPAGLAALLILAGAALVIRAENATSTAFEVWLHRCCFGYHRPHDIVWSTESEPDLNEALAAYYAIGNGMTAEIGYQDKLLEEVLHHQDLIKLRIVLPNCDKQMSAWSYSLSVPTPENLSQCYPLLAATHNIAMSTTARLEPLVDSYSPAVPPAWRPGTGTVKEVQRGGDLIIEGEAWVDSRYYSLAKLEVSYWPDRFDRRYMLGLQVQVKD